VIIENPEYDCGRDDHFYIFKDRYKRAEFHPDCPTIVRVYDSHWDSFGFEHKEDVFFATRAEAETFLRKIQEWAKDKEVSDE
jgi:hypothetical protein